MSFRWCADIHPQMSVKHRLCCYLVVLSVEFKLHSCRGKKTSQEKQSQALGEKEERFQNLTLMDSIVMPQGPRIDPLQVTLFHVVPEGVSGKVKKDLQALEH